MSKSSNSSDSPSSRDTNIVNDAAEEVTKALGHAGSEAGKVFSQAGKGISSIFWGYDEDKATNK